MGLLSLHCTLLSHHVTAASAPSSPPPPPVQGLVWCVRPALTRADGVRRRGGGGCAGGGGGGGNGGGIGGGGGHGSRGGSSGDEETRDLAMEFPTPDINTLPEIVRLVTETTSPYVHEKVRAGGEMRQLASVHPYARRAR